MENIIIILKHPTSLLGQTAKEKENHTDPLLISLLVIYHHLYLISLLAHISSCDICNNYTTSTVAIAQIHSAIIDNHEGLWPS